MFISFLVFLVLSFPETILSYYLNYSKYTCLYIQDEEPYIPTNHNHRAVPALSTYLMNHSSNHTSTKSALSTVLLLYHDSHKQMSWQRVAFRIAGTNSRILQTYSRWGNK